MLSSWGLLACLLQLSKYPLWVASSKGVKNRKKEPGLLGDQTYLQSTFVCCTYDHWDCHTGVLGSPGPPFGGLPIGSNAKD